MNLSNDFEKIRLDGNLLNCNDLMWRFQCSRLIDIPITAFAYIRYEFEDFSYWFL